MLLIKNGNIVTDGKIIKGNILIDGNKIIEIGNVAETNNSIAIDAKNRFVIPGFIDIHFHGAFGYDVMKLDSGNYKSFAKMLPLNGVTSYCAATLSSSIDKLEMVIRESLNTNYTEGAELLGIYLEGPFYNSYFAGAQNTKYFILPEKDAIDRLLRNGVVKYISLAPEIDNGYEIISYIKRKYPEVVCAMGHTNATGNEAKKGFENGITHITHCCNGMRGINHREIGALGAALLDERSYAEIILDGVHVDFDMVRLIIKCKSIDKIILITDSVFPSGMKDGKYKLEELEVELKMNILKTTNGGLAGSTLTMAKAFRNAISILGLTLEDAVKITSTNAAKELGFKKGLIEEGYDADLLILDNNYNIEKVIIQGKEFKKEF